MQSLNSNSIDDPIELRSGRWTLRLKVTVSDSGVAGDEIPVVDNDAASGAPNRVCDANRRPAKAEAPPDAGQDLALNMDTAPAFDEAYVSADRTARGPLENGADVAKAKLDVEEASESLANIAPSPSNHQLPPVDDAVLSSIVSQQGSWTLLSNRLTGLLGVADRVAEVGRVPLGTGEQSSHCVALYYRFIHG